MDSGKIRDYSIAVLCCTIAFWIAALFLILFSSMIGSWLQPNAPLYISSECRNESANVFVTATENLNRVKCVALDKDSVVNPEISIGDLSKGSKDVCRFKLSKTTSDPLRFEVLYNGKIMRDACQVPAIAYTNFD